MSTVDRSLMRRAATAACLTLCLTRLAAAQEPVQAPGQAEFLSHYNFHLGAAALDIADPRFSWDTHFGGNLDVVDYVVGRTSVLIDYEAVLGDQLRAFDPNQGNYTLEVSSSYRVGENEVAFVFHHVSRHLGDRPKTFAIAWNVAGVRALRHLAIGGTTIDADADIGWMSQHANVDYQWTGNGDVVVRRQLTPRAGIYARGTGQIIGVDSASRGTQVGGLAEAGVRVKGTEGVLELFAGYERRIDADPLENLPQHWFMTGFRLVRH